MKVKSTIIRWTAPALLPATLAVFWLLPVAAEAPVEAYGDPASSSAELEVYAASNDAIVVDSEVHVADDEITVVALETPADYETSVDQTLEAEADYDDGDVEIVILSQDELAGLVGPIALYPDDLLAIVLPASTYPLEIVQAARFLDELEKDSSLKPFEDWDESVTALLNYPEVVHMMNDDIEWTWKLGGAMLNQQQDVIAAVESFRDRAYAAGNLKSDDYQTVNNDGDTIEITRTKEEVIYVPYYEPERVVIRQVEPVYYYYPRPYPVYYYPYPRDYYFPGSYFWGVTSAFRIGWSSHYLHVHHHSFWGHPYYGRTYYSNYYYRRPSVTIHNNYYWANNNYRRSPYRYRDGDYWRPRPASGVRPGGHGVRRPAQRNNKGRDGARRDALLASQASNTRQVNRRSDRNVYRTKTPDAADRLRGRGNDMTTRDPARNNNRTIRGQRDTSGVPREYGDTIRFRERPAAAGSTTQPARRPVARPGNTAAPANSRPQSASTVRPRPLIDDDRIRERTSKKQRTNGATTTRQNRDTIRFRERPRPVKADTRPATRPQDRNKTAATIRPQTSSSADRQATRDQARLRAESDRQPARDTTRRTTTRPRVTTERRVTSNPATPRRVAPTTRETTRRTSAPVPKQQQRPRANRDSGARTKPEAAPKNRKSSPKKMKARNTGRPAKRQR